MENDYNTEVCKFAARLDKMSETGNNFSYIMTLFDSPSTKKRGKRDEYGLFVRPVYAEDVELLLVLMRRALYRMQADQGEDTKKNVIRPAVLKNHDFGENEKTLTYIRKKLQSFHSQHGINYLFIFVKDEKINFLYNLPAKRVEFYDKHVDTIIYHAVSLLTGADHKELSEIAKEILESQEFQLEIYDDSDEYDGDILDGVDDEEDDDFIDLIKQSIKEKQQEELEKDNDDFENY